MRVRGPQVQTASADPSPALRPLRPRLARPVGEARERRQVCSVLSRVRTRTVAAVSRAGRSRNRLILAPHGVHQLIGPGGSGAMEQDAAGPLLWPLCLRPRAHRHMHTCARAYAGSCGCACRVAACRRGKLAEAQKGMRGQRRRPARHWTQCLATAGCGDWSTRPTTIIRLSLSLGRAGTRDNRPNRLAPS